MNNCLFVAFISTLIVGNIFAFPFGKCPDIKGVSNFNPQRYAGKWYEIQRGPRILTFFEEGLKCVYDDFSFSDDKNFKIAAHGYQVLTGNYITSIGNGHVIGDGQVTVTFPSLYNVLPERTTNYTIVDTDYDNYSLVYLCEEYFNGLFKNEAYWVFSRTKTLSEQHSKTLSDKLAKFSHITDVVKHDHSNCEN